jgi:hypothetical protein
MYISQDIEEVREGKEIHLRQQGNKERTSSGMV